MSDVYSIARKHLEGKTLQRKARTLLFGHLLMSPSEIDALRDDIANRSDVSASIKAKALEILAEEGPQKERKRNGHSVKRAAGGV